MKRLKLTPKQAFALQHPFTTAAGTDDPRHFWREGLYSFGLSFNL